VTGWLRQRHLWSRWHWRPTPCADCRIKPMPNTPYGSRYWQRYMVYDHVWAAASMTELGGWLCIPFLERRLGRPLPGADFEPVPLNDPDVDDDTDRLAELKRAAAEHDARPT
jgi:hypothetical protein